MADVCLKNEGDQIAEINWGEYRLEIEPGGFSRPMPENMARKFTLRNQSLKAVPVEEAPPSVQETVGEPIPYTPELEPKAEDAEPEENHRDINRVGAAAKPRKGK